MSPSMSVAEYYAGKNIFITGATGLIGKVLIEKLLRSCPRVGLIYMLIRPKHGQPAEDRLCNFINCPIFDNLRKNSPEALKKLRMVAGDITKEALGLSDDERRELLAECNIVFHSAANVRFDLPLRSAIAQNTLATKRVLELAEGMTKIEVFVYVSTSYCQHEKITLEEKLYPTKHSPQQIIDLCDWMDDDMLAGIQSKLIYPHGNTYAYSKALTETLVSQYAGKFPIAIGRPSIVTAALKEPMPGWIDSMNGPTGVLIATGKGVLRSIMCNDKNLVDMMPLDLVVNGCILLAYFTALEKSQDITFCNITQSGINALTWKHYRKLSLELFVKHPFAQFIWVPKGKPNTSRIDHNITVFFTQLIPALFIDLVLYLMGKKCFMMKVYNRVQYACGVLEYYSTTEWNFTNDYFRSLRSKISKEDNEQFYTDIELLHHETYMENYVLGAQKYILKEEPADLPRVKRLFNIVWYIDKILTGSSYGLILYIEFKILIYI